MGSLKIYLNRMEVAIGIAPEIVLVVVLTHPHLVVVILTDPHLAGIVLTYGIARQAYSGKPSCFFIAVEGCTIESG